MQVLGANIVKSGSVTFAVYSIAVTDLNNNCWSIKRRWTVMKPKYLNDAFAYYHLIDARICNFVFFSHYNRDLHFSCW